MCDAAQGVECRPGFIHTGRRFELGLCWPGVRLGGGSAPMLEGACVATVETNYLWDFSRPGRDDVAARDAIVYRGACLGCGWAASTTHDGDENAAIADALDHALVGWRAVPVVERCKYDAAPKQVARWMDLVAAIYDGLGLDVRLAPSSGGVIRTQRSGAGTRSYFSHGFYDICGPVVDDEPDRAPEPVAVATQLGLF